MKPESFETTRKKQIDKPRTSIKPKIKKNFETRPNYQKKLKNLEMELLELSKVQ